MKKPTRRSHYIPQTYLRHFLHNDRLVMYKKGERFFGTGTSSKQRIVDIVTENALVNFGIENDLYDPGVPGVTTEDFEQLFQEHGENFYTKLVEDLEKLPIGSTVPKDLKDQIALFMGAMCVRTPHHKAQIEERDSALHKYRIKNWLESASTESVMEFCKKSLGKDVDKDFVDKLKKAIDGVDGYRMEMDYPNGFFLQKIIPQMNLFADIFYNMRIQIYRSNQDFFITTDNPVVYFVPAEKLNAYNDPKSLTDPFAEVYFPISKNIAALLTWQKKPDEIVSAAKDDMEIFNYNFSINSRDFIFAPIRMSKLEKFVEAYIPYPLKFVIR